MPNTHTNTPATLAATLAAEPFAWPGGYPCFALTDCGGVFCPTCCENETSSFETASPRDGWYLVAIDINYEDDGLFCDHCGLPVPCAYEVGAGE